MIKKIENLDALVEQIGVQSWPDLTQEQTYELLKLAGQQRVSTAILGSVIELAPTFRDLSI